jgi:glycosyltransferase involved in cell wall biosynthesis
MISPVYILIRTSRRPEFFGRLLESIKSQTYKNIVTIVHTDDPRDSYVEGDIIIKGKVHAQNVGSAPYNLYNNELLKAIPHDKPGWIHFIDDDDIYTSDDIIEKMVDKCKKDHLNVCHVMRWNNKIFPEKWLVQKSFQTECFIVHTDYGRKAKWWSNKGGDHYYSKQLTQILPINWIENILICKIQEGLKGHGNRYDAGFKQTEFSPFKDTDYVPVMGLVPWKRGKRKEWIIQNQVRLLPYGQALDLEKKGIIKFTYGDI